MHVFKLLVTPKFNSTNLQRACSRNQNKVLRELSQQKNLQIQSNRGKFVRLNLLSWFKTNFNAQSKLLKTSGEKLWSVDNKIIT